MEIQTILKYAVNQSQLFIDKVNNGELTRDQAEKQLVSILSAMNSGHHYLWANDSNGIARVHIRPEIIGRFQTSYIRHIEKLKDQEFSFVSETNVKPKLEQRVAKINVITKIPQWKWVIGHGLYMDDVTNEFWLKARKLIVINGVVLLVLFSTCLSYLFNSYKLHD